MMRDAYYWTGRRATGGGGGGGGGPTRRGRTRIVNRAFADDDGEYNALGATYFVAPWLFEHERDALDRDFTVLRGAGVDFLRILGEIGFNGTPVEGAQKADSYGDRTFGPMNPNWRQVLGGVMDYAYERYGFRTELTVFGEDIKWLTQYVPLLEHELQREQYAKDCLDVCRARPETVQFIEGVNEGSDQNWSISEMRKLAKLALQAGFVASPSCPFNSESLDELHDGLGSQIATMHYSRDDGGDGGEWEWVWKPYEYPWDANHAPAAACDNESAGPWADEDDPTRIAMSVWTSFVVQSAAKVFHAGPLIRVGGQWDVARGLPKHVDQTPGWPQMASAMRAAKTILPPGVANHQLHNGQWTSNPIDWVMGKPHNGPFEDGSLFKTATAVGPSGQLSVPCLWIRKPVEARTRQAMRLVEHDIFTGQELRALDLSAGQTFAALDGTKSGAMFTGQLR